MINTPISELPTNPNPVNPSTDWLELSVPDISSPTGFTSVKDKIENLFVGVLTGSGTLNYLPKWTPDGFTLGNSQIFDNGTNVGIGTAEPTSKLQVVGLPTYEDNKAALGAGLTAGAMYIRKGHGLDIVVK